MMLQPINDSSDSKLRRQLEAEHWRLKSRLDRLVQLHLVVIQTAQCDCFGAPPSERCLCAEPPMKTKAC